MITNDIKFFVTKHNLVMEVDWVTKSRVGAKYRGELYVYHKDGRYSGWGSREWDFEREITKESNPEFWL